MGFKVNTQRQFTVKHNLVVETEALEGVEASTETYPLEVTFKNLAGEDIDYGELRSKLSNLSDVKVINEDTGEEIDNESYNAFLYTLRKSLIGCKGFTDQDDNDLVIIGTDGKVNSNTQLVVFEAVRNISDFFNDVITAYTGLNSKN